MQWRKKLLLIAGCLMLASGLVVLLFWHEIQVAYHRNRMFAAMNNHGLLTGQTRMPTRLEGLKFAVFKMSATEASEALTHHESALLTLGHLERREFWLTNRTIQSDSNFWPRLRQQITNTFAANHWWSGSFLASNRFRVTAPPADMSQWEKLINDLDRQPR